MENIQVINYFDKVLSNIFSGMFLKLVFSKPVKNQDKLTNVYIRIILLQNIQYLSFTYRYEKRDEVKNYPVTEGIEVAKECFLTYFKNADLFTETAVIRLSCSKKGKILYSELKRTTEVKINLQHNREKNRMVPSDTTEFLRILGITNTKGILIAGMEDKYRQINKYLEIVESLQKKAELPETIEIVDMGAGKGYLTFALYDYFNRVAGKRCKITGVEIRKDLVDKCNDAAKECEFSALEFVESDIKNFDIESPDILVALHACDTATDEAIFKGIQAKANLIICAPCCHKEIRKQISTNNALKLVMKHGILEERQSEIITDGMRALLMELCGYKTSVFEFISSEHTGKNLMIAGILTGKPQDEYKIKFALDELKKDYGIQSQYLEKLLRENGILK